MNDHLPIIEFAFPGALRDSLIAAIETGAKTSTSSLMREYEVDDEALPVVGYTGCVVGSHGERLFAVETTGVDVVRLGDVPLGHALAEGEGYTSVADWRAGRMVSGPLPKSGPSSARISNPTTTRWSSWNGSSSFADVRGTPLSS